MDHATQIPFTTYDGHNLAICDWPLWRTQRPRATVLIVHGLGEHAWRYNPLATELNAWGFVVRAYDQRGHGDSSGKQGCLPHDDTLLRDLADVLEDTRTTHCRRGDVPLILLGHSMGGLVAALYTTGQSVLGNPQLVDALVLSSPALDPGLGPLQRALLTLLPPLLPDVTVSNGLDPKLISHDPKAVQAYLDDPRVHNRLSPRLARFIVDGGPLVQRHASDWAVPTLLMYAGADGLVDPSGSRRFAATTPPDVVQAHCFPGMYHELFNEANRFEVLNHLRGWLNERF